MVNIQVRIIRNDLPALIRRVPDAVDRVVKAAAYDGEAYAKQSMASSPASGRQYGNHTASSPGNPPRIDIGTLANSIRAEMVKKGRWRIIAGGGHAAFQEFGTSKMAARPFFVPMAFHIERQLPKYFEDFLG